MIRRRIAYGLALAAAVLFQICFTAYLGAFVLALAAVFPLFSLLLSLPGMLGCRLALAPEQPAVERGAACRWQVTVSNPARLPLSRLTLRLREENLLTGQSTALRRSLSGASQGCVLTQSADTAHCGLVTYTLDRARIYDLLGLFSRSLPTPPAAQLLVLPGPADPDDLPPLPGGGRAAAGLRPRPVGGPGEDYDLRAYRPGDPLRTVHWKLSSKWDDLVVREPLEECRAVLVLTFDLFGPPEALDQVLDRLYALSRLLIRKERPHSIQWAHPVSGSVRRCAVDGERALLVCLAQICATTAPATGRSILDGPLQAGGEPVQHLHLSAGPPERSAP